MACRSWADLSLFNGLGLNIARRIPTSGGRHNCVQTGGDKAFALTKDCAKGGAELPGAVAFPGMFRSDAEFERPVGHRYNIGHWPIN